MTREYKPGDTITKSGIYRVTHDAAHTGDHDVTCIAGKAFPACRGCEHPRFVLVRDAHEIDGHENFKRW